MAFTVFILSCSDLTFHFGVTKNLGNRMAYHQQGKNPLTKSKLPISLVYEKNFEDLREAQLVVSELQTYGQEALELLIAGVIEIQSSSLFQKATQETIHQEIDPLILPAVYLGNLSYFETVANCPLLLLDGEERYEKQTFRSRCTILSANGLQNLVIPVIRTNGKDTRMKDVQISYVENWQKDHLKAIESAYRKAPYYDYYAKEIATILSTPFEKLIDLNLAITQLLIKIMGWQTRVELAATHQSSSIEKKRLVHPKTCPPSTKKPYHQIFGSHQFEANLSLIDWLFNVSKNGV